MEELSFEQAVARLEEIVRSLEQGELGLDQTLQLFEEGIGLSRLCTKKLDEAEAKIEILVKEGQTEVFEVE